MAETIVVLADQQYGTENPQAISVAYKITKAAKPDLIVLAGDILDSSRLSPFRDREAYEYGVQEELDLAEADLARLRRQHPSAEIILIPGNHDYRILIQLLKGTAKEFRGLRALTLPNLLNLKEYDIRYKEGRHYVAGKRVVIKHGTRFGEYAAKWEIVDEGRSGMSGHNHKTQTHTVTQPGKPPMVWASVGCLCNLDPLYARWDAKNMKWNHGMGVITVEGSHYEMENVVIEKGGAIWRGRSFEA